MGFVMQCSSYGTCISFCVPHRFPQTFLSFHGESLSSSSSPLELIHECTKESEDDGSLQRGRPKLQPRKIVEHVCLLKAQQDLSEEEENDMLHYLYTTQYQMGGVVAISIGRIYSSNPERYTHALFMRFKKKENLEKFPENPFYFKVLKDYVMTYCHVCTNMD